MLTMAEIRQHTYNATLKKGRTYYLDGLVDSIDIEGPKTPGHGNTKISAKVSGSDPKGYYSYILINSDGKILDYDCTCPAASNYWGMCKHCVAAALEFQDSEARSRQSSVPAVVSNTPETSLALKNILHRYALQGHVETTGNPVGEIELDCYFTRSEGCLLLECKIGSKRKYVVKNLVKLVNDVNQGNHVQYGTNLEFTHSLSAFTEESQKLYKLLERAITSLFPDYQSSRYHTGNDYRYVELYHDNLEQFLLHYMGSSIELDGHKTFVADENPALTLFMQEKAGGANLTGEILDIYKGSSCIFIYKDFTFWRCTEEFAQSVLPILEAVSISEFRTGTVQPLYLSQGDYTAFCRDLVPVIEPYVTVESGTIDLGAYAPIDPEFSLYLRMPASSRIELTGTVRYGVKKFDLLKDGDRNDPVRNPGKENDLLKLLGAYFAPAENPQISRLSIRQEMYPVLASQYDSTDFDPDETEAASATASFSADNARWDAQGDDAVYAIVSTGLKEMAEKATLFVDATIRRLTLGTPPQVTIGVGYSGNLLNLDISVAGMNPEEISDVLSSYRMKKKYYRLKTGDFLPLEDESLETLAEITDGLQLSHEELSSGQALIPSFRALYLDNVLQESEDTLVRKNQGFRQLVDNVRDYSAGDFPVPQGLCAQLRKYQQEGYQWLCTLYEYGFGGILADDMGLGKTVQIIALMQHAVETRERFSALVVCPASLVYNWESEVQKFAPDLSVQIITGSTTERQVKIAATKHHHVSITSYDLLKRYIDDYADAAFDLCILDEAQYIKNAATQVAKAVKAVNALHRFALTGTPIENRLSDLWSIFDFLMPGYLYSYAKFKTELETPIIKSADETATKRLSKMVSPFLLRRKKGDVLKDLPDKLEEHVFIRMDPEQERIYTAHISRIRNEYQNKNDQELQNSRMQILAEITRLRQLCCSPALCYENYTGGSGKIEAIMELLNNAVDSGHRVLVFSQFTSMLEMLIKKWTAAHRDYLYLSGKDTKLHRQEMVQEFQNGDIPVFFISLKSGGTGLNLTAADTVIHCDPWWNMAAQNQATDRAHRIGQKNVVNVMKMVAKDTIEERIINLQNKKASLSDAVIEGDGVSDFRLDRETLNELFR